MTDQSTQDDLVKKLTSAVEVLSGVVEVLSYRLRRKRISDAVLGAVVAAMIVLGGLYYFVELPGRRADTRAQIRNLACYAVRLRPPGYSPTSDALRARYRCPPFDPAAPGASVGPSAVPSPSSTRRVGTGTAQRPSAAATPLPGASARPRPAGSQAARTAAARLASTSARRSTVGQASRPPVAATPTPLIHLPSLSLCTVRVAGLGLCPPA